MSAPVVTGYIRTKDPADRYGTHLDILGMGGYRPVRDIQEMYDIPVERRRMLMLVGVSNTGAGSPGIYWLNVNTNDPAALADNTKFVPLNIEAKVLSGLTFKGNWDPTTGYIEGTTTPLTNDPSPADVKNGWFWIANNSGTYDPGGGDITFNQLDWIVWTGVTFRRIQQTTANSWVTLSGIPQIIKDIVDGTFVIADNNDLQLLQQQVDAITVPSVIQLIEGGSTDAVSVDAVIEYTYSKQQVTDAIDVLRQEINNLLQSSYYTQAAIDNMVTGLENKVTNASQGISGQFNDIASRDAASNVNENEKYIVVEQVVGGQERNVYEFTGQLGDSGSQYWDFSYQISFERDVNFLGVFPNVGGLPVTASPGNYADVDGGVGTDVVRYIWDDDDAKWVLGTGSGDSLLTESNIIYVSKSGDNLNTGNKINAPKLTIQDAINTASDGDSVIVLDGAIYEESIVLKEGVNIYAEKASLDLSAGRSLTLDRGYVRFRTIFRTSGTNLMINTAGIISAPRGYSLLHLNSIDDNGTGVTIENSDGSNPLDLRIAQVYVRNSNVFLIDSSGTDSHTHVTFDDLYLYSTNAVGIRMANGGDVLGSIQHIKELGDGIGNGTAFDIQDGEINITAPDTRATTIANIESDGIFRFTSQRFSGAVNNNGGQYSYFTAGSDDGSMKLSTNLEIELDSDSLKLPRQAGSQGAFLSIGNNGIIIPTNLETPGAEWTDDTEGVTTVNTVDETIVYSVTVDDDADQGSMSFVINYTPGYYMNVIARLRRTDVNGAIIDQRSFNGSGTQELSYALPLSAVTVTNGDTFVLTVEFAAASPGNTINDGGFLSIVKAGTLDISSKVDKSTLLYEIYFPTGQDIPILLTTNADITAISKSTAITTVSYSTDGGSTFTALDLGTDLPLSLTAGEVLWRVDDTGNLILEGTKT